MSNIFDSIIEKYNLESNTYDKDPIVSVENLVQWTKNFTEKWSSHFVGDFYISLCALPKRWLDSISEVIDIINVASPQFRIINIKIKFGGVRLNLVDISEEVFYSLREIENVLCDDRFYF